MTDKEKDMKALGEAALQAMNAEDVVHRLIRQYRDEGYSLREIANAAGLSHEQVRRLTQ